MKRAPLVSVLLPTRNRARLLARALESIQRQSLSDIEILVLDDGSTDETAAALDRAARADRRIRMFHGTGAGAATALNRLASEAGATLVAVMHDDDMALPARLQRQVTYMQQHKLDVCGTWYRRVATISGAPGRPAVGDESIKAGLLFQPPLLHPSVTMRREAFDRAGGYDPAFSRAAEDYDLWTRLAVTGARFGNVPEVLMHYRLSPRQASRVHNAEQMTLARDIRARYLAARGIPATAEQVAVHVRVRDPAPITSLDDLRTFEGWLLELREHFRATPVAAQVVARQWLFVGCRAAGLGMACWKLWRASPLAAAMNTTQATLLLGLCMGRVRYRSAPYRLLEPFAPA